MSLYIDNYFKTIQNISAKKLESIKNIFSDIIALSEKTEPKSILKSEYKLEIEEYIKKNNILKKDLDYFEKIKILEKLSDYFNQKIILQKNIEDFTKILIYNKSETNKIKYLIDNYLKIEKKLNYNIINNSKKNIVYDNPINFNNKNFGILNESFFIDSINKKIYSNYNEINISTDILLKGNIINISLPSIGLVDTYLSKNNTVLPKTIINFIEQILNEKNIKENISNEIPFLSLNIGNTLSSILLNVKNNNVDNNIYNKEKLNNTKMESLIENMINNIQINLNNVFLKKSNNKKQEKIKPEYIIPYKYDIVKKQIVSISKSEIEKINDIDKLIKNNRTIVLIVIINVFKNKDKDNIKRLNDKNYKNVLACFLFYIIRVFYDILKEYINNIDQLLTQILDVKEKRFGTLNIKDAFEYTSLLNNSLYKFKLILLNNFYQLFIPSKIIKNNYGMEKDSNNCYIPESNSIFLNSDEYIYDNYPFNDCKNIDIDYDNNIFVINDNLNNYILNIKERNDIYNNNDILEFGGYSFNKEIMKISTKKINEYFNLLQKNNNFTLFIIDKLINIFIVKENIPYELINDLEVEESNMTNPRLSDEEKDRLMKFLVYKFEYNIEKSTNYYLKLLDIRKKIKESKKMDISVLYNIEEMYKLCFKIFYIKGSCMIPITQNVLSDIKLKNMILMEYSRIKKSYEKKISKYISKLK
jgi:hypothetical protein